MAIYHFHAQVISRSAGRSSVAAGAYRAAEKYIDERTGLSHDFTKKSHDVFYKTILTPENSPEWMKDRETLWNRVEQVERRKDAQLSREFNIALPRELNDAQNIELAHDFVQKNFVDKGMVADLCLHQGHSEDGEKQPHIHVMVTLREVTPDGFGKKVRAWNSKEYIQEWREAWAKEANYALALQGHDMRIDHRRLEEQGIELEPQTKIGSKAAYSRQARYEEHQQIARENGERIYEDPTIALNALISQQSTFTHQDLARFVNRHTADCEQFNQVFERVKAAPELVRLGQDDLQRERFTTQGMLALEHQMIDRAIDHSKRSDFQVKDWLCEEYRRQLFDAQKKAFDHVLGPENLTCILGSAGTGKSYMMFAAHSAWRESGYRVQGMAISGKAAEHLQHEIGIKSHTIANRLINWENDRERLTSRDIIVVDEASMIGSRDMAKILKEAHNASAKVVLIGDIEQIQSIQAGAAFRAIAEHVGFVEMLDIRRQKEAWQCEATKAFATGRGQEGLLQYEAKGHIHAFETKAYAIDEMVHQWEETRSNQPDKTQLMMAYTRADVKALNDRARERLHQNEALGTDHLMQTERGKREFAENDRVYFLKNDKHLDVKNGSLGTLKNVDEHGNMTVLLDKAYEGEPDHNVHFNIKDYPYIDHGYAATVHKAQGSTVDYSYVLASKHFDRQITYPAMSRHRTNVEVYYSREEFQSFKALATLLDRDNKKDVSLDYRNDFAQVRNIQTEREIQRLNEPVHIDHARFDAAEKRLLERQCEESLGPALRQFERDTGRKVSFELEPGDRGIYRGSVKLGDERFGILEQGAGVKLLPYEQCQDLDRGQSTTLEQTLNEQGERELKPVQEREITKAKEMELDLEL